MEQNREPRNKPRLIWSINFDKGAMKTHLVMNSLFNKYRENWISTCKKMKLYPYFILFTNNSRWIKDLNVRPETEILLEDNKTKGSTS